MQYNGNLLNTLNKVRAGDTEEFVINYNIASSVFKPISQGGLLGENLSDTSLRNDVYSAVLFWSNLLNTIYKSNKKVKGSLKCKITNSKNVENSLNISIKAGKIKTPVKVNGGEITLNSSLNWKSLVYGEGLDIFSHVVYGIGKVLGIGDSYKKGSVMNKSHLKVNYISNYSLDYDSSGIVLYPDSIVDLGTIKKVKSLYGSMLYTYPIVYGCTDKNADNYNPLATRSNKTCTYSKRSSYFYLNSNIYFYDNKSYTVVTIFKFS